MVHMSIVCLYIIPYSSWFHAIDKRTEHKPETHGAVDDWCCAAKVHPKYVLMHMVSVDAFLFLRRKKYTKMETSVEGQLPPLLRPSHSLVVAALECVWEIASGTHKIPSWTRSTGAASHKISDRTPDRFFLSSFLERAGYRIPLVFKKLSA